ncbi:MAG: type II secretion system secretin GspD [Gammaproteobacteria bacterium]|nr:type II secretion system secretin GspD [Gammaproteobacteria bacterium]
MKHVCLSFITLITTLTLLAAPTGFAEKTTSSAIQTTAIKTTENNESPAHPGGRLWNLQDADILSVINEVSLETGKNFVIDPRVSGKITLVSSKPIAPKEVYAVFLSILELLGYSAIESDNVVKVIPNMESTEMASRVASSANPGHGNEVVVRVIPLENVSAVQVLPVIRPMLPQWSNISAYAPGNVLILVGHANNLKRIINVIKNLDSASTSSIQVIRLHQASAAQIAAVLNNLQSTSRANGETTMVSIVPDERSNSILLSGNKSSRLHIESLIAQLDSPMAGNQGNTEVIYLRYLQAKNLAPVLGKIAQNILRTGADMPAHANPVNATNKTQTPENLTNIQAENSTNALIITAPPTLLKALKTIVGKLDIRPAQVLVEGVIVEINQDDLNNMGIIWGSRLNQSSDTSTSGASPSVSFPPLGAGTIGIIPGTQIKAILSLLENKTGVNILSTPSVVVLDNQKASLKVGQDVPYQNGTYATTGNTGTVTPFNTISTKPVVLQLDVIPQINLGNAVRLQIHLQNDTLQNPENPTLNPIIKTSEIKNTVIINSQDILVIGGLISNNMTESASKIPFLGDIPIAGILFQHKIRKLEKKMLVAFLKPVIMHDAVDSSCITNTKYNAIRQRQIDWPVDLSQPGTQKLENILPLWDNPVALPKPFVDVN